MKEIEHFLERIKADPAVHLGRKDIVALSHALAGYEDAIFDLTGRRVLFNSKFQRFAEQKYRDEYKNTVHWSTFLLQNRSEEEAFDLFFALFEEFLTLYPNWEDTNLEAFKGSREIRPEQRAICGFSCVFEDVDCVRTFLKMHGISLEGFELAVPFNVSFLENKFADVPKNLSPVQFGALLEQSATFELMELFISIPSTQKEKRSIYTKSICKANAK